LRVMSEDKAILPFPYAVLPHERRRVSVTHNMGKLFTLVLLPAALALSCQPQSQPGKTITPGATPKPVVQIGPPGFPPAVLGKPYPGTGIVKILNRKEGWVEIDHEEIKDLMPAMEMEFWVRDPSIMDRVRVGDKVDFVVVEDSKGQYLTELKRAAPDR
jgi:Cu/Ag efflux protein CusF